MNDSDKFQQLGLDDLEEVSGGEALSDRAVAALPKAVPGGICPYCGMSTKDPKFKDTHLYLGEGERFCEVECKTYPGDEIW